MRKDRGINETFTVRRIVNNEGVERIFPLHSPFIAKVVVRRGGETRRAKLFYLRNRVGKAVRLTEKRKVKRDEAQVGQVGVGATENSKSEARELAASAT
jgi:large subunit ribosomal protein L19